MFFDGDQDIKPLSPPFQLRRLDCKRIAYVSNILKQQNKIK
ncbi:hypothetical protein VRK_12600 [Vibrio sp. MEBiC08052]|nr:hypothetical protein VRK_12600 [Vibrio sp. MEBiC08052]